jgi:hypothetical protein
MSLDVYLKNLGILGAGKLRKGQTAARTVALLVG